MPAAGAAAAADAGPPAEIASMPTPGAAPGPPPPPPAPPVADPLPAETGIAGTWRLADTSSGVSQVSIAASGGGYVLDGMGPQIRLEQDGDSYFGEGAVLFGQGDHSIVLQQRGSQIELRAEHPGGGSFTTMLMR
jgi:hypothetical protein